MSNRCPLHVNGKWLSQNLTGTQRYASEMVRAIVESDRTDLVLHVPKGVGDLPRWTSSPRVSVRRAPVGGMAFEQIYLPLATARRLLLNFAGPAPILKINQLVTMHDATPFRYPHTFRRTFVWFYLIMYGLLGRTARYLVTVSNFSASELDSVLHIPADKFLVAPCSANSFGDVTPVRPDLALPDDYYLVVGTQAVHKNLNRPVTAVAESGRDVVIVGLSGNRQVFSETTSLDQHATVPGRLSDEELVWLYQNSRALIFPSKYEGFGLPPVEAQHLGVGVVTSTAAAMPEVCADAALYFDPDDTGELLTRLGELESNGELAADLCRRGHDNAARFSWQRSAASVLDRVR